MIGIYYDKNILFIKTYKIRFLKGTPIRESLKSGLRPNDSIYNFDLYKT